MIDQQLLRTCQDLLSHQPPPCDLNQFYAKDYNMQIAISLADQVNIPFGVYKMKRRREKGYWTQEQDQKLLETLSSFPENWKQASINVSTIDCQKCPQQCQQRWRRVLNPYIKKGRWELDEDLKLQQLQQQLGKDNYLLISQAMPTRSYVQVRNRIKKLTQFNQTKI